MQIPGSLIAMLSSCAKTVLPHDKWQSELSYQINLRMKQLYREGYRRFRVVPMAKTGDADRCLVMGWPS